MKRFIEGESRSQSVLFPERLDDYIDEDNPVRVIDAFVDELDLGPFGFEVEPEVTGRPGYHPATLLKVYIYGYLNRVQSSRRLERETQRNVEVMWLTGRLSPDFKTLADFRRDNGKAIQRVCAQFIALCRSLKLFTESTVAIDGSKFKAVNQTDRNFSAAKIKSRIAQLEHSVARYLEDLDRADRMPGAVSETRVRHVRGKIDALKRRMKALEAMESRVESAPDGQVSLTDPDARRMSTKAMGSGVIGYNVQSAVDTKHHLIVAHEVTMSGSDRRMLAPMAGQARDAMGKRKLTVLADKGYFSGLQIKACEDQGITTLIPRTLTSTSRAAGRFDKRDFQYLPRTDRFRCPAGEYAIYRYTSIENGMNIRKYWSPACPDCALRARCTTSLYRRIPRWEHEAIIDRMQRRLESDKTVPYARRRTVEHPFATIKERMGTSHFLMKTLKHVKTEMSLHVLAYNLTRMINLFGTQKLIRMMAV